MYINKKGGHFHDHPFSYFKNEKYYLTSQNNLVAESSPPMAAAAAFVLAAFKEFSMIG
jgi:hypothetical protein